VWPGYPDELTPTATVKDKLLILEDTNQDGVADKCTTFLDGLNCPDWISIFQGWRGWWCKRRICGGCVIPTATTNLNSMERGLMGIDSRIRITRRIRSCSIPGGATYLSDGVFHRAQTETPWGVVRNYDAAIYRYEPLTHKYERYAAYGFANPHGRVFDRWGTDIITDATGNNTTLARPSRGFFGFPGETSRQRTVLAATIPALSWHGLDFQSALPDEWQGDFLNCNVIGMRESST
jgi:hypothetical protein